MTKKETGVATVASEEQLAQLKSAFPAEQGFTRNLFPRLGMFSQDQTEGKGKAMKVVTEAGTFFLEHETEEIDPETKKKIWQKDEIGTDAEVIIIFQRKQLRFYDESDESYTSSSVYDTDDEVIPLWKNKAEIARGTAEELKARPEYQYEKDGKVKSKLEDNRILYVLYNGELYQMNLRGSSMYSWMSYQRKVAPPTVLTHLSSEAKEKGTIAWNQMTFEAVRQLNNEEAGDVIAKVGEIKEGIAAEKEFFATQNSGEMSKALKDF